MTIAVMRALFINLIDSVGEDRQGIGTMRCAESSEDFWRFSVLLLKAVDGRYQCWEKIEDRTVGIRRKGAVVNLGHFQNRCSTFRRRDYGLIRSYLYNDYSLLSAIYRMESTAGAPNGAIACHDLSH